MHTWLTDDFATTLSIADTSVSGTASITSTTLSIVDGKATIAISGDEQDWLDSETVTLSIAAITVAGVTVSTADFVITFTTP